MCTSIGGTSVLGDTMMTQLKPEQIEIDERVLWRVRCEFCERCHHHGPAPAALCNGL